MMTNIAFYTLLLLASTTEAFTSRSSTPRVSATSLFQSTETKNANKAGGVAGELGNPCEDECAMTSFPNLPESVHPGVLSGKAMMDLLQHAKENGE
jgi:fructose-bisphosphate aldolase class II